jgi:hypothetical protein
MRRDSVAARGGAGPPILSPPTAPAPAPTATVAPLSRARAGSRTRPTGTRSDGGLGIRACGQHTQAVHLPTGIDSRVGKQRQRLANVTSTHTAGHKKRGKHGGRPNPDIALGTVRLKLEQGQAPGNPNRPGGLGAQVSAARPSESVSTNPSGSSPTRSHGAGRVGPLRTAQGVGRGGLPQAGRRSGRGRGRSLGQPAPRAPRCPDACPCSGADRGGQVHSPADPGPRRGARRAAWPCSNRRATCPVRDVDAEASGVGAGWPGCLGAGRLGELDGMFLGNPTTRREKPNPSRSASLTWPVLVAATLRLPQAFLTEPSGLHTVRFGFPSSGESCWGAR